MFLHEILIKRTNVTSMDAGPDGVDEPRADDTSHDGWPQDRTVLSDRQRHLLDHLRSAGRPVRLDELTIAVAAKEGADIDDPTGEVYESIVATSLPPLVAAEVCTFTAESGLVELTESDRSISSAADYRFPAGVGVLAGALVAIVASRWVQPFSLAGALAFIATLAIVAGVAYHVRLGRTGTSAASTPEHESVQGEERSVDSRDAILELILEEGGRMKQSDVVESVGLSKSAISRHLSSLEEDGLLGKFSVGRENVVYLDGMRPRITPDE